jgi:conjugative relaxase-like TrwC/TraI family protein
MSLIQAPSAGYYIQYVADGCERPGEWMGEGAKLLDLSGKVEPAALQNLFAGLHPDGTRPLINISAIRHDRKHIAGYDLRFPHQKT